MHDAGFWIAALTAAVLVGLAKGGLQAVGGLAVPILALAIHPITAAGLLLPVYVFSDIFGLIAYRKAADWSILRLTIPAAAVGIGIGWATAEVVPERAVLALVGLIALVFALNQLLRRAPDGPPRASNPVKGGFWAVVAGFTSFVSHGGGPPWQVYMQPLRLSPAVFAGTSTVMFAAVNAIKLIPYYVLGQLDIANLKVASVLLVPAALSVLLGVWIVRNVPTKVYYGFVTWALLLVGVQLLYDAWTF